MDWPCTVTTTIHATWIKVWYSINNNRLRFTLTQRIPFHLYPKKKNNGKHKTHKKIKLINPRVTCRMFDVKRSPISTGTYTSYNLVLSFFVVNLCNAEYVCLLYERCTHNVHVCTTWSFWNVTTGVNRTRVNDSILQSDIIHTYHVMSRVIRYVCSLCFYLSTWICK